MTKEEIANKLETFTVDTPEEEICAVLAHFDMSAVTKIDDTFFADIQKVLDCA